MLSPDERCFYLVLPPDFDEEKIVGGKQIHYYVHKLRKQRNFYFTPGEKVCYKDDKGNDRKGTYIMDNYGSSDNFSHILHPEDMYNLVEDSDGNRITIKSKDYYYVPAIGKIVPAHVDPLGGLPARTVGGRGQNKRSNRRQHKRRGRRSTAKRQQRSK